MYRANHSLILLRFVVLIIFRGSFSASPSVDKSQDFSWPPSLHDKEAKGDESDD
jgi:hypothetical protein